MSDFVAIDSFVDSQLNSLPIPADTKNSIRRAIVGFTLARVSAKAPAAHDEAMREVVLTLTDRVNTLYDLLIAVRERVNQHGDCLAELEQEKQHENARADVISRYVSDLSRATTAMRSNNIDLRDVIARTSGEAKHPGPPGSGAPKPQVMSAKSKTVQVGQKPGGGGQRPEPQRMVTRGHSGVPKKAQPLAQAKAMSKAPSPLYREPQRFQGEPGSASNPLCYTQANDGMQRVASHTPIRTDLDGYTKHSGTYAADGTAHGHAASRKYGTTMHVLGTERISSISRYSTFLSQGRSLMQTLQGGLEVNPLIVGGRMRQLAQPYSKYKFNRIRFFVVPSISMANSSANGSYLLGANYDPDAPPPELGTDGVNGVATWTGNFVAASVFQHVSFVPKLLAGDQAMLFVDSTTDARFDVQFRLVCVAGNEFSGVGSVDFGTLYMEYDIELSEPNLPSNPTNRLTIQSAASAPALATGSVFVGATYYGDTAIATTINTTTPALPQLLLNGNNGAITETDFSVTAYYYANASAATFTAEPAITITAPDGTLQNGWAAPSPEFIPVDGTLVPLTPIMSVGRAAANGFFRYGNLPTASNAVGTVNWRFRAKEPVSLMFTTPGVSSGSVRFVLEIAVGDDDQVGRTRAQAPFLTVDAYEGLTRYLYGIEDTRAGLISAINAYVASVDAGAAVNAVDLQYIEAFHRMLDTALPKAHTATGATAPMFLPLLAGAAAWLIGKIGPAVASHVLGYGVRKLTEYAEGRDEEPSAEERKRAREGLRRRKKRTEEEGDDVNIEE